ncbi:MAG: hypothetical protein ACI8QS_002669, partial [Planctomycetota bacterium]
MSDACPPGWFAAGSHPPDYAMGMDPDVFCGTMPAVRV